MFTIGILKSSKHNSSIYTLGHSTNHFHLVSCLAVDTKIVCGILMQFGVSVYCHHCVIHILYSHSVCANNV